MPVPDLNVWEMLRRTLHPKDPTVTDGDFTLDVMRGRAPTDRSGAVASGNTSQVVMAGNPDRKWLFFENVSTGDEWVSFETVATVSRPSIQIISGAAYENPAHFVPTGTISVVGSANAMAYVAKEA